MLLTVGPREPWRPFPPYDHGQTTTVAGPTTHIVLRVHVSAATRYNSRHSQVGFGRVGAARYGARDDAVGCDAGMRLHGKVRMRRTTGS